MKKHVLFSSIPKLLNQTDSSLPIADKLQIEKGTAAKKGNTKTILEHVTWNNTGTYAEECNL